MARLARITFQLGLGLALIASCTPSESEDSTEQPCDEGKCDGLPFLEQLNGRNDPIAQWFRAQAEQGNIDPDGKYSANG